MLQLDCLAFEGFEDGHLYTGGTTIASRGSHSISMIVSRTDYFKAKCCLPDMQWPIELLNLLLHRTQGYKATEGLSSASGADLQIR